MLDLYIAMLEVGIQGKSDFTEVLYNLGLVHYKKKRLRRKLLGILSSTVLFHHDRENINMYFLEFFSCDFGYSQKHRVFCVGRHLQGSSDSSSWPCTGQPQLPLSSQQFLGEICTYGNCSFKLRF